jgi:hypothetical protein
MRKNKKMGLHFSCDGCWDTPCTCGNEYKRYTEDYFVKFIFDITKFHNREAIIEKLVKKLEENKEK